MGIWWGVIFGVNHKNYMLISDKVHEEFRSVVNRSSIDAALNTPDYILADYLVECLKMYEKTTSDRDAWWGLKLEVGGKTTLNGKSFSEPQP